MADCSFHPGKDAVGACVSCGKMVCVACKTELHDKVYCPTCANKLFVRKDDVPVAAAVVDTTPAVKPVSGAWWLLVILPLLFGGWCWIGGIIAWAVNKDKDSKKAKSMLVWGIILSVIYLVLAIIFIALIVTGFLILEMPGQA
jgi:DNA-directed RNA polymerase subunit RPC12/RpoP